MKTKRYNRIPAILLYSSLLATVSVASAQTKQAPPSSQSTPEVSKDDTITLSPFEVVENTKGYYSSNSMSGTRFNASLQDLGSAITVVSTEQMKDFGMLDINDIFLYTVGTEGTGTFSDFAINQNGELTDNVSLNPTTANRVRGIASANISYGNFEMTGRMPIDPTVLSGVEISRGPNANVFGLGNPSGTVNQVPMAANTTKNKNHVEFRVDSYGGWRGAMDINRYLLKNKLAIRVSASSQHDDFVRKPTGVETKRYNVALKIQPFKNTSINAVYLDFEQHGNRPNFTPPRDFRTYWVESGKARLGSDCPEDCHAGRHHIRPLYKCRCRTGQPHGQLIQ